MNNISQNTGCVFATLFGALTIRKGYDDFKNDHKVAGAAKMVFGTMLAGSAVAYAVYSIQETVPTLEHCYNEFDTVKHPSCPKVLSVVEGALQRGEMLILGDPKQLLFPPLSPESSIETTCSVTNNGMGELECFVKITKKAAETFSKLGFNLGMGRSSSVWSPTKEAVAYAIDKLPTTQEIFKQIPGCEAIQRLQVHLGH